MAFGQIVTGPPGAGKTTYCHGVHQFLSAIGRPVFIVNLDPAVPNPPYPCAINITELLTLEGIMKDYELGPNGAMLYAAEFLEANIDWLIERLDEVLVDGGYVVFDTPGQVELWTNHDSLRRVVERLTKLDYRLVAVHLSDAHHIVDASKFISVALLALRAMMHLELPHVNVLSKIDLLATYGELPFDLRYYAECRDLEYLLDSLDNEPGIGKNNPKMRELNRAMVDLIEEQGSVSFETLAVEDKRSMLKLIRVIDRANGYVHIPGSSLANGETSLDDDMEIEADEGDGGEAGEGAGGRVRMEDMPDLDELGDVDDVQERWGRDKARYDEEEEKAWEKEWAVRGGRAMAPSATIIRPEGPKE